MPDRSSPSRVRTARARLARAFVLVALSIAGGCGERDPHPQDASGEDDGIDWGLHVASHSDGWLSREARIVVRFVRDQVDDAQVGAEVASPLRFEPPIDGTATWQTRNELHFLPARPLASGATYRVALAQPSPGDPDFPAAGRAEFRFAFRVLEQSYEVAIDGFEPDPDDASLRRLTGSLRTADVADAEAVAKTLRATHAGAPLEIEWLHAADRREHRFAIAGVRRSSEPTTVALRFDGEPIGVDERVERDVELPAAGAFSATRASAGDADGSHLVVRFSDPLDASQDLTGLVRIDGADVRATVDGSALRLDPAKALEGRVVVRVEAGVRSRDGAVLGEAAELAVEIEKRKPGVRFVGKGVILPEAPTLAIPFEAAAVDAVYVTALEVYESNIGRFLQDNALDGQVWLQRVGRHLFRKRIELDPPPSGGWQRYSLDATELLRAHPGALVQLTLEIRRRDSTYDCPASGADAATEAAADPPPQDWEDLYVVESSSWDGVESSLGMGDWRLRDDPCNDAYYARASDARSSRNFLASNLGLVAKRGATGGVLVVATDLRTAAPLAGVSIELFDFQDQRLAGATTNAQGFAEIPVERAPFYAVARRGDERGYLKLSQGTALATSHFDVGGEDVARGVKGQLYGERGVWRPGDDIHLALAVHDPGDVVPDDHPVVLTLLDPSGRRVHSATSTTPVGALHRFDLTTEESAPTGRWLARAQLGGMRFELPLRIESIVPNRLKVELDLGSEALRASALPRRGTLVAQWLHGAVAAGLRAEIAAELRPAPTRFTRFQGFAFDDPAGKFESARESVFAGSLDDAGRAPVELAISPKTRPPGLLSARFTTRVFEEGGASSSEENALPYHAFDRYVGLRLPPGDRARGMLLTDVDHEVAIATVDPSGEPVAVDEIEVSLYELEWKWWWDRSGDELAEFVASPVHRALRSDVVSTRDGERPGLATWKLRVDYPKWGRFLVRACDRSGGHCTGSIFYIDWPGWAGRAREDSGVGATVLSFSADRDRYAVGDTAVVSLPAAQQGRALVSIETGSRVLSQRWVDVEAGENSVEVPITREMSPTAYVAVSLVQPHATKESDRPIRLYGYVALAVDDPATALEVELEAPDETRPRTPMRIEVAERAGRPFAYTLAIVDEGLLGLTKFATPNLRDAFFRREALGVRTWDVFDHVVGAYGGDLERLLALGGSDSAVPLDAEKKQRRFPPVVRYLGPFALDKGERRVHEVELPDYVGAVRVMVVGAGDGAYGSAQHSTLVRDDLMLLATLPRVLGTGEEVALPVSVFATKEGIRSVDVRVEADGLELTGERAAAAQRLTFARPGDAIATFSLRAPERAGTASVVARASSPDAPDASAQARIDIPVRSANPPTQRDERHTLAPGESIRVELAPHGVAGTNDAWLELSSLPPIDLGRRLAYLVQYPHGCVEQTTSAAFPQLFLRALRALTPELEREVQTNVESAIRSLRSFQTPDGSFASWPGASAHDDWSTSYAGHFLLEAKRAGYHVPVGVLADWLAYQRGAANRWVAGSEGSSLAQAYRLYTLALAGEPEVGAMNRLREHRPLGSNARWLLASAYQRSGLPEPARAVVERDEFALGSYDGRDPDYGSRVRDEAIFLLGQVELARGDSAQRFVEAVSARLASDEWLSTQSTSFALLALAKHAGASGDAPAFTADVEIANGPAARVEAKEPHAIVSLAELAETGGAVRIANSSMRTLHATVASRGVPRPGEEQAASRGLALDVRYTTLAGEPLAIDRVEQGRDFLAVVEVRNTGRAPLTNVALLHVVPAGFEIHDAAYRSDTAASAVEVAHRDVRDDRVSSYFELAPGERKTFRVLLNAAYRGRFYAPAISVEAMYDGATYARTKGRWVQIVNERGE